MVWRLFCLLVVLELENVCHSRSSASFALLRTSSRDDDDEFLYGDSELKASSLSTVTPPVIPSPGENPLLRHSFCILLVPTKYIRLFAHNSPRVRVSR